MNCSIRWRRDMTPSRLKPTSNSAAPIRNSICWLGANCNGAYGQESQIVLTTPILEGLDGVNKMSKSLGNAIGIHEPPLEMYGKIMSISDDMMWRYYELLTDVRTDQIAQMKAEAASGKAHPMALKKELARSIVADFHSAEAAAKRRGLGKAISEG